MKITPKKKLCTNKKKLIFKKGDRFGSKYKIYYNNNQTSDV